MKKRESIEKAIERGIDFIARKQLPSGEIPTVKADNKKMENATHIKTVTITSLVLWALRHFKNFPKVSSIIRKGIDFLISEKENDMEWRFFGKGSDIIPDMDDTVSILTVLKENNIPLNYLKYAMKLIKIRNEKGLFYTWFPEKGEANNIDWVVNAIVLYFFQSLGIKVPEVEEFLVEVVQKGLFKKGSLYYHSPYAFAYYISNLYADCGLNFSREVKESIVSFILENYTQLSCIDLALSAVSLSNFKFREEEYKKMINLLINMQMNDGGWPIGTIFKHRTKEIYYGSRELTTAIALEGLYKFFKANKD